jgi:hypothetical protein
VTAPIIVVTTFNRAGLETYGRTMIETFDRHWPREVELIVFAEDCVDDVPKPSERVKVLDLLDRSEWLRAFKRRHAEIAVHNGRINGVYEFRADAVRFAHKVAAIDYVQSIPAFSYLIWLDADTITHTEISLEVLESWLPNESEGLSWLPRGSVYAETGFIAFNACVLAFQDFFAELTSFYRWDHFALAPEWHDAYLITFVVERRTALGELNPKSLSGDDPKDHPFVSGPLGAYMDHMKGDRKAYGKSKPWEALTHVQAGHPYWSPPAKSPKGAGQ